jgi:hypothetical protein
MSKMNRLKFNKGNAKLGKHIYTFSLPAGHSCPFARECLSKAGRNGEGIQDGKHTRFRCFAASSEAQYEVVRDQRWENFELLKGSSIDAMASFIELSLPQKAKIIRIHVSGDFFSQDYFDAWLKVCGNNPDETFYAYTKSLRFWVKRLGNIPQNLKLNASRGGMNDSLIDDHGLKSALVVFSYDEAKEKGLKIDHDDSHAYKTDDSFALLIHGTQPAGSEASKALSALKVLGWKGYSSKKKGH